MNEIVKVLMFIEIIGVIIFMISIPALIISGILSLINRLKTKGKNTNNKFKYLKSWLGLFLIGVILYIILILIFQLTSIEPHPLPFE